MTLWNYLAMFILGLAIFEVCMHVIVETLESKRDYGSPLYRMFVGIAFGGVTMSTISILKIFTIAEKQVKTMREKCEE